VLILLWDGRFLGLFGEIVSRGGLNSVEVSGWRVEERGREVLALALFVTIRAADRGCLDPEFLLEWRRHCAHRREHDGEERSIPMVEIHGMFNLEPPLGCQRRYWFAGDYATYRERSCPNVELSDRIEP
jgi:hypothetical protein